MYTIIFFLQTVLIKCLQQIKISLSSLLNYSAFTRERERERERVLIPIKEVRLDS